MAKKYLIEDNEVFPGILFQEEVIPGYTDFSSDAILIDRHGKKVRDYLFVRDDLNNILFPKANPGLFDSPPVIDFSGFFTILSAEERKIMCKYILAPYALRLTQFSDSEDESNWFEVLRITQGLEDLNYPFTGRSLLIERMRKHVANKVRKEEMSMEETQKFFKDVFQMIEWYIRSACPDFKLWLTNAPGSIYEFDGFEQKTYWSQELEDELLLIYNGLD